VMALTNIASMNEEMREHIMEERGWQELRMLLASDNAMLQRAAIEGMTNLVMCGKTLERLKGAAGDQDIQFFLIFAQSDDLAAQTAATGALAMISGDEEIAKKIIGCTFTSTIERSDLKAGDELDKQQEQDPSSSKVQLRKTGLNIVKALTNNPSTNPEVMRRVEVIWKNLQSFQLV